MRWVNPWGFILTYEQIFSYVIGTVVSVCTWQCKHYRELSFTDLSPFSPVFWSLCNSLHVHLNQLSHISLYPSSTWGGHHQTSGLTLRKTPFPSITHKWIITQNFVNLRQYKCLVFDLCSASSQLKGSPDSADPTPPPCNLKPTSVTVTPDPAFHRKSCDQPYISKPAPACGRLPAASILLLYVAT